MYSSRNIALSLMFWALVFGLAACSSGPEPKSDEAQKAAQKRSARQAQPPSKEQLKGSPCGNPDWAQLPEGAEGKAPAEKSDDAAKPAEKPDASQPESNLSKPHTDATHASEIGVLGPKMQPCT